MPTSFKTAVMATFYSKTPSSQLVECQECGGVNIMGRVAKKVDCTACSKTGYANYFTGIILPVFYTPRPFTRWNESEGGRTQFGECQIKVDGRFDTIVNEAKYVHVKGQDWNFQRMTIPGAAFGQERLVLALSRKSQ